jgi:excisionase family DNA binding protein
LYFDFRLGTVRRYLSAALFVNDCFTDARAGCIFSSTGVRQAAQGESEMTGKPDVLMVRPVEAAAMLSISRSSVYELVASGALPSVRVGGRMVRIPVAAIRRMAESATDEGAR